jgi:hypothetical protein
LKSLSLRAAGTLTGLALVVAIVLLTLGPSQAFAADTSAFNLQSAINACPSGGTVNIPAGTYYFESQVSLKSGVTLQGAGVDQTVLSMPAKSAQTNLLALVNVSNVSIKDLTLSSPAATGKVLALHLSNYSNVTIERVFVSGCEYGLKADTAGSNLTVRDFKVRASGQCYISNLTGGLFENLDVEVITQYLYSVDFSALYLCAGNHDLVFNNFRARGGSGWTIQLWSDYGPTEASDNIEFNGLDVAGWGPLALGYDFSDVRIRNAVFGGGTERSCVRLYGLSGVVIDGFSATGGTGFLQCWAGATNYNVSLKNGIYSGTKLIDQSGGSISNLTVANVATGATATTSTTVPNTTTNAVSTTSTTATTATTVQQTTSTTLPQATTTTTPAAQSPSTTTTTVAKATTPSGYVKIRSPGRWSTVSRGLVPVRATVSSTQKVAKLVCYIDGKRVGRDYQAPYRFVWNTRKASPGSVHTLTVVAYNKYGAVISKTSRRVVVSSR